VVAGVTTSRGQKSDKVDAYNLAEKRRVGALDKHIFKAPRRYARLREFSRTHMTLVTDTVRIQSRIKSLYRSRGILVAGVNVYGVRHRSEWMKQLPTSNQPRATRLYDHLDFVLEQKKQAEADLVREAKKHPIVRILETAPGFGPIRAARLAPMVVTPHRFRTKRQFWSYCGLGIVTRSSSDWVQTSDGKWIRAQVPQTRGLSRQYNHFLKDIFKGSCGRSGHSECHDGDHPAQPGSHLWVLRATARWRHKADTCEAELGANDRSHSASNVEGRKGVRARTSRSVCKESRKLGRGSLRRLDEKAISYACIRERCSQVTDCVNTKVSIHERLGPRPTAWRHPA